MPPRGANKILDEYIHIDYFKFIGLACLSLTTWVLCKSRPAPLKGFFTDTLVLWILSMVPELPKSPSFIMNKQMTKDKVRFGIPKGILKFQDRNVSISDMLLLACRDTLLEAKVPITIENCPSQAHLMALAYNLGRPEEYQVYTAEVPTE